VTKPVRVAVIDDHDDVRELISILIDLDDRLELAGTAADAMEGARLVEIAQPDVVLLDLMLPVVSGIEAMPDLLRRSPGSRIVVFTAAPSQDVFDEAMAAGATACVTKGDEARVLTDVLAEVGARAAAQDA
jgi:DNA-binding NarL/FixJ family response regulator